MNGEIVNKDYTRVLLGKTAVGDCHMTKIIADVGNELAISLPLVPLRMKTLQSVPIFKVTLVHHDCNKMAIRWSQAAICCQSVIKWS